MVLFGFITRRIEHYKQKTIDGVQIMWDNFFKGGMLALVSAAIIWLSVFLYVAFYYYYMPSVYHQRPVNLQFKACEDTGIGMCSYPAAHVQLTKFQQLLMIGQTYRIYLKLEMPESQANKDLGMFMVCAQLADKNGMTVSQACRSAMLHYRSALLTLLTTLTFYPMFVLGHIEEKQTLLLELYSNFEEDQNHPVTDVYIELQTRHVEYYSASIHIQAHLKGLRYLMFHWPLLSAALGICSNIFFIVFISSVSWWHVFGPRDENGRRIYPGMNFGLLFGRNLLLGNEIYGDDFYSDAFVDSERESSSDVVEEQQQLEQEVEQQSLEEQEEEQAEQGEENIGYAGGAVRSLREFVTDLRRRRDNPQVDDS